MLSTPAPFPFPGARAFLVPSAEPCRILQRRADGRVLISLTGISPHHPDRATAASGNRTVDLADLAATEELASLGPARPRSRRRNRGQSQRTNTPALKQRSAGASPSALKQRSDSANQESPRK